MSDEDVVAGNRVSPEPPPSTDSFLGFMQQKLSDFASNIAQQADPRPGLSPIQLGSTSSRPFDGEDPMLDDRGEGTSSSSTGRGGGTPSLTDSPLRRAGLLQPRSYTASLGGFMYPNNSPSHPHTHSPDTIRQATMELSAMPGPSSYASIAPLANGPQLSRRSSTSSRLRAAVGEGSFIFPLAPPSEDVSTSHESSPSPLTQSISSLQESKLDSSIPSLASLSNVTTSSTTSSRDGDTDESSLSPLRLQPGQKLSGLSLLRPTPSPFSSQAHIPERVPSQITDTDATPTGTPRPRPQQLTSPRSGRLDLRESITSTEAPPRHDEGELTSGRGRLPQVPSSPHVHWRDPSYSPTRSALSHSRTPPMQTAQLEPIADETTPLLIRPSAVLSPPDSGIPPPYLANGKPVLDGSVSWSERLHDLAPKSVARFVKEGIDKVDPFSPRHLETAIRAIPAVILGSLLNILDGVSYGMILFPATGVFSGFGPMGVSMFFVSAVVAQAVFTFGGSGFAGGNGSMMIEIVPFFHILANDIQDIIGEDKPEAVIATTLVAFSFSALLTGTVFYLLGALKLGVIVGFFPRHILVGCIGGVGVFLIVTGFAVSMGIPDDDFTFTLETIRKMFLDTHSLTLWLLPLFLAVLLRVITHRYHHQLIFPLYFIIIPFIFYIAVVAGHLDLSVLRKTGWLFDVAGTSEPWYQFYRYLDFKQVWWSVLWSTMPTQFALLFFNILHPPLNVPALAVSLDQDLDTNKELVAHGYSNILSGLVGSVPNYLVYVNTLLFYRVGGTTRISSFLLGVATLGLLLAGTGPIAYLPVMVVGALIFVLGLDLVKEALWDTRHRTSKTEYITIVSIIVCMTVWDFVIGVLFGIVVSCFFFVVQNSHGRSIRSIFTGDTAMSAVRRPNFQRAYIREVARQTTVMRLQGFLFFGTITYVEEAIRDLIDGPTYQKNPVQFLVLDFTMVAGVDMSSAEALVRVQRLLSVKGITLVLCGLEVDSVIGQSLDSVGLLNADRVELFTTFSDAMEWTENIYLRTWYRCHKNEVSTAFAVPVRRETDEGRNFIGSFIASPRRSHLREAGDRTIATEITTQQDYSPSPEPLNTIIKAFSYFGPINPHDFAPITQYLVRIPVPPNYVLWRQGDQPDGMYIVESGLLRAVYTFQNSADDFEESMVPGTLAGELSTISNSARNCTVVVEHAGVLWKMSRDNLHRLQLEQPELARSFVQFALKAATIDYDILLTAMAARQ